MDRLLKIDKVCGLLMAALCFLYSCDDEVIPRVTDPETQPTQISINLTSTESRDGFRSYRMTTPLMERYELAKEPFSEFTKGIHVQTFNDSTSAIESELTANYAHFDELKEIWEARGNVIGRNHTDNKTLYTEQLFWDQKTDKIYSDKRVKVVDGQEIHIGTGFESNGAFTISSFRNPMGSMEVSQDTTAIDEEPNGVESTPAREGLPVAEPTSDPRSDAASSKPLATQSPQSRK